MTDRTVTFTEEAWEILQFQARLLDVPVALLVKTRAIPGPGVTLSFGGDPDEVERAETAIQAGRWKAAVNEMDQWLRSQIKWPPSHHTEAVTAALEEARKRLHDILEEEGIELW